MRVCLVVWSLEAGGAERVMAWLANSVGETFSATLVTLSGDSPDHYRHSAAVERVRLTLAPAASMPWTVIRNNLSSARILRSAIRDLDPDLIISFMDRTNSQVLFSTLGMRIPVIVSERVDPGSHPIPRKARILRRLMYPRASAVVVQTQAVRMWTERFVDPWRIHVIPNPVSIPPNASDRAETILGMGRLVDQKGFDLLLRAFAQLPESHRGWRMRILGDGEKRAELEGLATELGIDSRVEFPGITRDPAGELSAAGMFVLSSRYEGFPNVLLEAMASGTPSIAFDCPSGPGEIIDDGSDGLLVESGSVTALRDAIQRLIENPSLRSDLGARARVSVRRYSPENVLSMWDDVIAAVAPDAGH